jgi:small redox-active disulfide protein 2
MMQIKILGTADSESTRLATLVNSVISSAGIEAAVEKVENHREISRYGVLSTPALMLDGVVRCRGRVPSIEEICRILKVDIPRNYFVGQNVEVDTPTESVSSDFRPFTRQIRK